MDVEILFEGSDIRLTKIQGTKQVAIITFNAYTISKDPIIATNFEKGFACGLFAGNGFTEYHIVTNKNDWFQSDEMEGVIHIIQNDTKLYKRIVSYGSSMGGFGAINFSEALHSVFVTLCPQYSIRPQEISGDMRWAYESSKIKFHHNYIKDGSCINNSGYIFYDCLSEDGFHAEQIKKRTCATLINIPYAGHLIGDILNDVYGIKQIVEEIALEEFSEDVFNMEFEYKKQTSIAWLIKKNFFLLKNGTTDICKNQLDLIPVSERLLRNTGLCLMYLEILLLTESDATSFAEKVLNFKSSEELDRYTFFSEKFMEYKKYDMANTILKKALLKYKTARLFYNQSVTLFNLGELDEALISINNAILIDGKAEYYYYLGELLLIKQDYLNSEKAYLHAIQDNGTVWYYYSGLSSLYNALGRHELARENIKKAISVTQDASTKEFLRNQL
ncbi:hypothetical protein [Clostridium sp. AM58-1XD]|uniref:tetratricopeptide repeat protein n=1 Tax=Clostridium sp. AM58-1XD TaxID=2292307 RepID=UPI000E495FE2|nr:hypothetical protein [Clostridium sp. AM58-1XD]RGY94714.1 hypothetical protein DXA13_20430 [Clostridium sp. AM58-1XD]